MIFPGKDNCVGCSKIKRQCEVKTQVERGEEAPQDVITKPECAEETCSEGCEDCPTSCC